MLLEEKECTHTCTHTCTHCKSTKHIIENHRDGEVVCTNCGTVQTTFLLVHKNKKARTEKT